MRVAYILYNERPMSGILRSQVLALLHEIKKNSQNVSIELICFWQPHIFITHRKELKEMNIECYTSGIILKNYFICPPNRLFDTYLFTLSMIKRWIEFFLKVALKKDDFTVRPFLCKLISTKSRIVLWDIKEGVKLCVTLMSGQ